MTCRRFFSGEAGIRTLGRVTPTLVFKTSALDRSATSPELKAACDDRFAAGVPFIINDHRGFAKRS